MSIIKNLILKRINNNYGSITYFSTLEQKGIIDLIRQIRAESSLLLNDHEAFELFKLARLSRNLEGDIAEVGMYQGGSAKLMLEATEGTNKKVFGFDTFEGLPGDDPFHGVKKGEYQSNFDMVKAYLSSYDRLSIIKGLFPDTVGSMDAKVFSLVHIDTDMYQSTLDALKFFYPKLSQGGFIVSHDYVKNAGVKKAFAEFCELNSYPYVLEFAGSTQGIIIKR